MAVFKCKMCGAALKLQGDEKIIECEFCGTQQTLPRLTDETRENLYDRANHFRRNNDYDKAMSIYEQILNEEKTDAEAYWSIVLCRYGIEYVEDPATKKRVPTINRAQFASVLADEDYKSALQYADSAQKKLYEAEAKAIDKIQKGILAISQAEEPFDVFICYKEADNNGRRTPDSVLAQELYYGLKDEGFKVFFARITLEDKLGSAYEPYIFAALNSSKAMVVLGTRPEHFKAVWVKNEWSRYLSLIKNGAKKTLIPAYKGMDPYDLPDEFSHLQAQDISKLGFMQDLIRGIKKIVNASKKKETPQVVVQQAAPTGNVSILLTRMQMSIEDGEFDQANKFAEQILNQDPTNAQAYLGKLMAEFTVKSKDKLGQFGDVLDKSTNYARLLRFGDKALIEELKGYVEEYKEKQRQKELEEKYTDACRLMQIYDYEAAVNRFAEISDYKDSALLKEECRHKADLKKKAELYNKAKEFMNSGDVEDVKHAKKLFESIKDYSDSLQKSRECDGIIEILIERQQKQEKQKKLFTLWGSVTVIVLVIIIIVGIGISNAVTKAQQEKERGERYATAVMYMEQGDYDKAENIFQELGSYKDSETQYQNARYLQAFEYLQQEKYDEAEKIFKKLGDYKDSEEQCQNIGYLKAMNYMENCLYDEAENIFKELGNYKDSAMQLNYIPYLKKKEFKALIDTYKLTTFTIPNDITSIGDFEFKGCGSLTEIVIPDSVGEIGDNAFMDCNGLLGVYITDVAAWCNISFDGYGANPLCYAQNLYLNNKLVTELIIPDSVTSIGEYAFLGCNSLTSVVIGDNVASVSNSAFNNCSSLTSVVIGGSVTSIGDFAFAGCESLTEIVIPNSVRSISNYAFSNCSSLTSVKIGGSVTSIGSSAFSYCSSLTSVVIPDSVARIGDFAFVGCESLTSILFEDPPNWYRTTDYQNWQKKIGGTSTSVGIPSTNATNFTSTYCTYYWYNRSKQ